MDKVEVFPSITSIYQLAVKETVAVWSMKVFTKYAKTTQKKQNKPGCVYIKSVALTWSAKNNSDAERLRCSVRMCMFTLLRWYLLGFECACMSCYAFVCTVEKES